MKILNFASANIDYVYDVPHILRPGETLAARSMDIFPGGKGLNQSVAAAKAGGCVYHAGFIGSDGDFLVDILERSGAKLPYLQRVPEKNGHAMIQVNSQGENCIVIFQGTNGLFTEAYIDRVLEDFEKGDYVLAQNEITYLPYILDKAAGKGPELDFWLKGKSPVADYLARNTQAAAEKYAQGKPWSRVIWDVTAVAWLLNAGEQLLRSRLVPMELPGYDYQYHPMDDAPQMRYVYAVCRDALMEDLIHKISE